MELTYLTGQRPADTLKLSLPDIQDGSICLRQNKTNKRLRIAVEGQLAQLIEQLVKKSEKSEKSSL
jgi:integrase